jgi:hypothetical protein
LALSFPWSLVPPQAEFWFAIGAGGVVGAIVSCGVVYIISIKASREATRRRENPRIFPPPWSVEEHGDSFIIKDATGQILGCSYFADEPLRWWSTKQLTKDEAREVAANIANLPDILSKYLELTKSIKLIRDTVDQSFGISESSRPASEHVEALRDECEAIAEAIRHSKSAALAPALRIDQGAGSADDLHNTGYRSHRK